MTLHDYHQIIAAKRISFEQAGFSDVDESKLPARLFDHQRHGTSFALRCGRAALFYDTGLGKTGMALVWGSEVVRRTNKPVLMLAPLAVGAQHVEEAAAFGIEASQSRDGSAPFKPRIVITNYERLEKVDPSYWGGVILDESSILKSFTGKTTRKLIDAFAKVPYRLCATATPAPNDHTELGQHSHFLGVMPSPEMLSRFFIADQTNMGRYRLKKPAVKPFWDWVASWARAVSKPSDLGYSDAGFEMPPLNLHRHLVAADRGVNAGEEKNGQIKLFRTPDLSATSVHQEKRLTSADRAAKIAELVAAELNEPWVIWVETDYDADAVREAIPEAVEVRGSMPIEKKEDRLQAFAKSEIRILLSKPSICGFGLNWQHCARMAFMGLSFSYESFYQAVRRCWRFRQKRAVNVHIVCADTEEAIWHVVSRKAGDHDIMKAEMTAAMARSAKASEVLQFYQPNQEATLPAWLL